MFTGIVTDLGRIRRVRHGALSELGIATSFDTAAITIGASIACSGACLTVVAVEPGAFTVQASAETLARTTIGDWREGMPVNLERPLRLGDEMGGISCPAMSMASRRLSNGGRRRSWFVLSLRRRTR